MEIKYLGHACFSIKEGGVTIVTDPYEDKAVGLKMPKVKATVVTVSHDAPAYNHVEAIEGEPKVFNWPGEYETQNAHFIGIHSFHNTKDDKQQEENTIFKIEINGIKLCHLGAQGAKLTTEQLEKVGDVDVLFIPVGDKDVISSAKAKEVVEAIEPRVVIPMCYSPDGGKAGYEPVDKFLTAMGAKAAERVESLNLKRSDLPEDQTKVVVLNVIQ